MANDLPQVGAEVVLDVDSYNKSIDDAISRADELDTALNDLGGTVNANIEVDSSALTDLEDTQVDVGITVDDSELPFDEIPTETNTDVNLTETEDAKTASDDLHFMANLKRIETVINIAGNVLDVIKDIGGMVVSPFLDVEDAVAKINAQTGSGTGIDDLGQFIRDIQAADLGDSVDQISDVVIAAQQLHAPIEEATTASLTFTKVFKNQDPVTVMATLKSLSDEFGISMTEASNLMTVFFQNGGNKAGDALATVDKYSQSWKDMGLTIPQALSAVQSLMSGGVDSADAAAKMVQTFDDAATKASADPNSAEAKMLNMMGIDNPKDQGQAIGAKTIDGFVAAFNNLPADQQDLASGLFFGKTGKLDTSAIGDLTTQSDMFKNVTDAASAAATEIDNSLRGAIDDFVLEINTKVAELLSSDAIDLPGKIAALKEGLQQAVEVLANGGTIGEAIEVGLNIPGFNDAVNRFEASIGNFVISVLEIISGVQQFLGKDNTGTERQITQAEQQQLPFNLKVANSDEIAGELQTAIDRGLSGSDIAKATGTALDELIAGGQLDKAQALVDGLKTVQAGPPVIAPDVSAVGRQEAIVALRMADEGDTSRIQEQLDKGNLIAPVSIDTEAFQMQIDDAVEAAKPDPDPGWWDFLKAPTNIQGTVLDKGVGGKSGNDGWWETLTPPPSAAENMQTWWDSMKPPDDVGGGLLGDLTDNITTSFDTMNTNVGTSVDATIVKVGELDTSVADLDAHIATATTENTITASFDAVLASAEANFPGVITWFETTAVAAALFDGLVSVHLRSVNKQLNDLNFLAMTTIGNVTQAKALGGSGPVTNNTTTTVNVTNNNNNGAQLADSQYTLSQSLGGG